MGFIVDHLKVDEGGLLDRAPSVIGINVPDDQAIFSNRLGYTKMAEGSKLEYNLPITLFLVDREELLRSNTAPAVNFAREVFVEVVFSIHLGVDVIGSAIRPAGIPQLYVSFERVKSILLSPEQRRQIEDRIRETLGQVPPIDIPLNSLFSVAYQFPIVANAGITLDTTDAQVALRFQFRDEGMQVEDTLDSWKRFFAGDITSDLGCQISSIKDKESSLFIHGNVLVGQANNTIKQNLSGSKDFSYDGNVSGEWKTEDGTGYIESRFSGEVIDACNSFGHMVDVNVDVTVKTKTSLPAINQMVVESSIDWDADNWELLGCELSAALLWPSIGYMLMYEGKTDLNKYLLGIELGPAVVFIAAIIASGSITLPQQVPANCTKSADGRVITCTQDLSNQGNFLFKKIDITGMDYFSQGILLSATIQLNEILPTRVEPVVENFSWQWENVCTKTPQLMATAIINLNNNVRNALLSVGFVAVINDPFGQFTNYSVSIARYSATITCNCSEPALKTEYLANPYPLQLLAKTNGGARIISVPPPFLSSQERAELLQNLPELQRLCSGPPMDDPFFKGKKFDWNWRITSDPPGWGVPGLKRLQVIDSFKVKRGLK